MVELIPIFDDNYVFLFTCPDSGQVAIIDPGAANPVLSCLKQSNRQLNHILLTHHHWDHINGVQELCRYFTPSVWGNCSDFRRLPPLNQPVKAGDKILIGASEFLVMCLDGHTIGHIGFYNKTQEILFCGDTLFAMGCGRIFEGTPLQMWKSLDSIRKLPESTQIYCTHEYSLSNSRFACQLFPNNQEYQTRQRFFQNCTDQGIPTVPTSVALERLTNPFLQADSPTIARELGMPQAAPEDIFARLRYLKDCAKA